VEYTEAEKEELQQQGLNRCLACSIQGIKLLSQGRSTVHGVHVHMTASSSSSSSSSSPLNILQQQHLVRTSLKFIRKHT
jgi:hypothetical protein